MKNYFVRLLFALLIVASWQQQAESQTFNVNVCSSIPTPVEGQTFCFEGSTNTLKKYSSGAWVDMVGAGYNRIQEEGGNLAQQSTLNFIGAGVTCADNAGKTECTFTGGSGSQHQVNGGNLTSNDPVNYRTTATIQATNPSAGNVDFNVVGNSIGNAHIADAALSAAKVSGTAVVQSRTISTTSPLTGGGDLSANRTIAFVNQAANLVLSGPTSGGSAAPTFRSLVDADIPSAIARDSEINVTGTANEICSSGSGVAPTLSICASFLLGGKTATQPNKVGTTLPATCSVGYTFFKSDAPAGQNVYGCTATNVWTLQGDGGGGGSETDPIVGAITGLVMANGAGVISAAVPNTDYPALLHAARHQHGGADEVGTSTPGANLIPKSLSGGKLAQGWIGAELYNGSQYYCSDSGSSDAYVCSLSNPPSAYVIGSWIILKPNTINTGAATVNVNGLGVVAIVQHDNTALADGMLQAGRPYRLDYDGTSFRAPPSSGVGGGVSLSGSTANKIPKILGANSLGESQIADSGTSVDIGNVAGNRHEESYASPTGTHQHVWPAVSGDVAHTTGSKPTNYCARFDSSGRFVSQNCETHVQFDVFDFGTDVATGDGKFYFRIPAILNGMNLTSVAANVVTTGTTGTTDVQIARCVAAASGNVCSSTVVDMLSTKLTIDSGENDSATAATAAVINASNDDVSTGQLLRIDVDAVSTTAPKGLVLNLGFSLP